MAFGYFSMSKRSYLFLFQSFHGFVQHPSSNYLAPSGHNLIISIGLIWILICMSTLSVILIAFLWLHSIN